MNKPLKLTTTVLIILVLAACTSPAPPPAPTMDLTQVANSVNATLTAVVPPPTQAPTSTSQPSPTATAPLPTPTLVPIPGDPAAQLGKPSGVDTFDSANNWSLFNNQCFSTVITGGQFVMLAKGQAGVLCWEVSWPLIDNYYIETSLVMPATCNPSDRFGLFFRAPDNNRGYLYGYTCSGQYSLTVWNGTQSTVLVNPTNSSDINIGPNAPNRMGLYAFGPNYYLYANGKFLAQAQDTQYVAAGKIGYFVQAATTQPFTVKYDSLAVWLLTDQFYPPAVTPPVPTVPVQPPAANAPTVKANVNVNVRSGPGTQYPVLGVAPQGTTGQVLGMTADGTWYAVKVPTSVSGSGMGWVSATYVTLSNPGGASIPVLTPPQTPPTVPVQPPGPGAPQVTIVQAATIRQGPTPEFPVYGILPAGTIAQVAGQSQDGNWWAIVLPTSVASNGLGWVFKGYTVAQNVQNVPTFQTPKLPNNITPAAPGSGAPAAITLEPINVRSGPGNTYPSYGKVPTGTIMAVIGRSSDSEFIVVNLPKNIAPSGQGWVPTRYVTLQNAGNLPVIQAPPVPPQATQPPPPTLAPTAAPPTTTGQPAPPTSAPTVTQPAPPTAVPPTATQPPPPTETLAPTPTEVPPPTETPTPEAIIINPIATPPSPTP